jgi:hypothetical protein
MRITGIEWVIVGFIVLILAALVLLVPAMQAEQAAFLAECQKHEPRYQCEVKWKQMHPDPIVVIAPFNR